MCRRALGEAGEDPILNADLHFYAAAGARRASTLPEAVEHARLAVEFAAAGRDDARHARALAMFGHVQTMSGVDDGIEALERASELESSLELSSLHFRPSFLLGITLLYLGEFERSRPLLRIQLERANDSGDEVMRGVALSTLAELELRAGNWPQAYRLASDGALLQEQAGTAPGPGAPRAARRASERVHGQAGRGSPRCDSAARVGAAARRQVRGDLGAARPRLHGALARELGCGGGAPRAGRASSKRDGRRVADGAAAAARLRRGARCDRRARPSAGGKRRAHQEREAMGAHDACARARADRAPRGAITMRQRGSIADALVTLANLEEPFERGRTQLVAGVVERRAGHRAAARTSLTSALDTFDGLGAALWVERTVAEIGRIPGRSRAASQDLTAAERRVAELVAEGRSNKEVAATLFLAVRTVEAHLSHVYAKLGVRSRTELARRLDPLKSTGIHDVARRHAPYVDRVDTPVQQPLSRYLVAIDRPGRRLVAATDPDGPRPRRRRGTHPRRHSGPLPAHDLRGGGRRLSAPLRGPDARCGASRRRGGRPGTRSRPTDYRRGGAH